MFELFKKSVLAGLGTAVVTKTKVQETMQKMVDQGKLTSEDAERITKDIIETGESEYGEMRKAFNSALYKALSELNIAGKSDLEAMQSKMENLEKRMEILEEKLPQQQKS